MRFLRRFLIPGLATAVAALGLAALSGVPFDAAGADAGAVLRLSWRTRVAAVRECREPTEEELARLPAHMRRDRICDWRVPPHRLRVRVDGRVLEDATIEAAGVRGDRPLYVYREFPLPPGTHELEIRFSPLRDDEDEGHAEEEGHGKEEPGADAEERELRLALRGWVEMSSGDVILVTFDPDRGRLVVRDAGDG